MTTAEDMHQTLFLERCLTFYSEIGVPALIAPPDEQSPYSALILRLTEIGSNATTIDLEISFIPGLTDAAREGVYILQTFAVLSPNAESGDAAVEHDAAQLRKIAEINATLPIGSFGIFPGSGALYYKHNTMLHRDALMNDDCAARLDQQNGLILHQLQLYLDHLV